MTIKLIPESTFELEPELERHYQQYLHHGQSEKALAETLLGDRTYVERVRMPKYNGPVNMLREPRVAIQYAQQFSIPSSKSAHRQRADYFLELMATLHQAWNGLADRCIQLYGEDGPLVSGVYRDHFPEPAKNRLRFLAHGRAMANDAYKLHTYLTKTNSPYYRW